MVGLTISLSILYAVSFWTLIESGRVGVCLRDSTVVAPVLEVQVLQGQRVVNGLDIVGENLAVAHLVSVVSSEIG